MKKISLIILFILFHLIGISQKPNYSLPKQKIDSSKLYKWGNKMLTKKQLRDTLRVYYNKFTTK